MFSIKRATLGLCVMAMGVSLNPSLLYAKNAAVADGIVRENDEIVHLAKPVSAHEQIKSSFTRSQQHFAGQRHIRAPHHLNSLSTALNQKTVKHANVH